MLGIRAYILVYREPSALRAVTSSIAALVLRLAPDERHARVARFAERSESSSANAVVR